MSWPCTRLMKTAENEQGMSSQTLTIMYNDYNVSFSSWFMIYVCGTASLPARASEQGNVIGSVHIYICVYKKNL